MKAGTRTVDFSTARFEANSDPATAQGQTAPITGAEFLREVQRWKQWTVRVPAAGPATISDGPYGPC